jgi:hypothetical protein
MLKRKINTRPTTRSRKKEKLDTENDIIDLCETENDHHKKEDNDDDIGDDVVVITGTRRSSRSSTRASSKLTSTSNTKQESKSNPKQTKDHNAKYQIFCDLDGVLVDFEQGVLDLFNNSDNSSTSKSSTSKKKPNKKLTSTEKIPPFLLWSRISKDPDFFTNLDWTVDGVELWNVLLNNNSSFDKLSILTGCPRSRKSRYQKFDWCENHLDLYEQSSSSSSSSSVKLEFVHVDKAGKKSKHELVTDPPPTGMKSISSMFRKKPSSSSSTLSSSSTVVKQKIEIITCWSKNKHCESGKNHVLIDDRLALKDAWEKKGGIFVHHVNTKDTIEQMVTLGIIE